MRLSFSTTRKQAPVAPPARGILVVALFTVILLAIYHHNNQLVAAPVLVAPSFVSSSSPDALPAIHDLHTALSKDRLDPMAHQFSKPYRLNLPFPHISIDGLFPESFLRLVLQELTEPNETGCIEGSSVCFRGKSQQKKSTMDEEEKMGIYTRMLFEKMKGSSFVQFLEELTGIDHLIPDPHYRGSGIHVTAPGGFLDVHADFNKYKKYNLDRRVNVFVYMNEDWNEEYGGHLELWSEDMQSCYQRILPSFNRLVVFSSTDFSYHGHPQALPAPRSRRSIALYYYTNGRPSVECLNHDCSGNGHTTLFQKPQGCQRCEDATCQAFEREGA